MARERGVRLRPGVAALGGLTVAGLLLCSAASIAPRDDAARTFVVSARPELDKHLPPAPVVAAAEPSPTASPTSEARPVEDAAGAWEPTSIEVPAARIDAAVDPYTDEMVEAADGWVDPPDRDVVAWWTGGGTPGRPADNTVYLYGHVGLTAAVFNDLDEVGPGSNIMVTTPSGTIEYEVEDVLPPILKSELPNDPRVTAAVPGRLVLVGCHREPDQGYRPTTSNLVVIAQQVD